jgi:NADPH-dependent 2,4-dienoyl-CoA reductase/sulfur reductase-like enzyme
MTARHELTVIGAGPAGLAAATTAAELGLEVALFDDQPALGGQIYRGVEQTPLSDPAVLGEDYRRGVDLAKVFRVSGAAYHPSCGVWLLTPEREIGLLDNGQARFVTAGRVIIAGGAMERPVPFPGWTLPGVMTAGAGQILLKSAGMVPEKGVVLAGTGPLLLLLAAQYLRVGVQIAALLDMTPRSNALRALPHLPAALSAPGTLAKGLALKREIRRAGVRMVRGVRTLRALGETRLEAVAYKAGGREDRIEAGLLLVHFGVIPDSNTTRSLGIRHLWDPRQLCWRPEVDAWGNTGVEGYAVAGDGAGIGGALVAEHAGRLAALETARALGHIDAAERDERAAPVRASLARERRVRPFLDVLFQPAPELIARLDDDTIVCRCEEVTAGQVREAVGQGCTGPNQLKSFTRCGMGPCQGRQCGTTVSQLIGHTLGRPVEEIGAYRIRPPLKPISLTQLAALDGEGAVA